MWGLGPQQLTVEGLVWLEFGFLGPPQTPRASTTSAIEVSPPAPPYHHLPSPNTADVILECAQSLRYYSTTKLLTNLLLLKMEPVFSLDNSTILYKYLKYWRTPRRVLANVSATPGR